ncbi:MAG: hypothetical protein ACTTKL_09215 [Treponema sp.]
MKANKLITATGVLVALLGTAVMIAGCKPNAKEDETPEYKKEELSLKFKNETSTSCYVEIEGNASMIETIIFT